MKKKDYVPPMSLLYETEMEGIMSGSEEEGNIHFFDFEDNAWFNFF